MRIVLASNRVLTGNIQQNVESIVREIKEYAAKADLILFGETALQGFDCLCWNFEEDCKIAISQWDNAVLTIRNAAQSAKIAVSFGYIEKTEERIFSSQMVIDSKGEILHNYRRVSSGWRVPESDKHYAEGVCFKSFNLKDKKFVIGLCGDLWQEDRVEEMWNIHADVVLWPVWCDYNAEKWNNQIKYDYAAQAALCGRDVLLVNPFCIDISENDDFASGGSAYFRDGEIVGELPAGCSAALMVEI